MALSTIHSMAFVLYGKRLCRVESDRPPIRDMKRDSTEDHLTESSNI